MKQLTRAEAKVALGDMPERTFARWCAKGLPCKGSGEKARFPWPEVLQWIFGQLEKRGRESVSSGSAENDAKMRSLVAKAEMDELDLAERRGQLMTVEDGERVLAAALGRVRAQILAMPGKAAPQLVAVPSAARAHEIIRRVAEELMEDLRASADDLDQEIAA